MNGRYKLKLVINKYYFMFAIILYYPLINLFFMYSFPEISGRVTFLGMCIILLYMEYYFCSKRKIKKLFLINIVIFIELLYHTSVFGYYEIFNADFYAFIFILYQMFFFSEEKIINKFGVFVIKNRTCILISFLLFLLIIVITVINGTGLTTETNNTLALKGPYDISHTLAYTLIIYFSIFSFLSRNVKTNIYGYVKIIILLLLITTAVRSAFLTLAVIYLYDYNKQQNAKRKIIVLISFVLLIGILDLTTGIVTNTIAKTPIMKKTLEAANHGSVSNGRERFALQALDYYKYYTTNTEKMFGIGIEKLRKVIALDTNTEIHAHNDIVNILVGYGYIYLIIFLYIFLKFVKGKGWLFIALSLFILLYTNGLFMYKIFTICLPLMKINMIEINKIEIP